MNEEQYRKILTDVKNKWGQGVVEAIKKKMDEIGINDTGALKNSIKFEGTETPDGEQKWSGLEYANFQDQGVNPVGQKLYETPYQFKGKWAGTAQALKSWGKLGEKNEWAVAYKIQYITGLKPRRFIKDVVEAQLEVLSEDFAKAYQQVLEQAIQNSLNSK